VQLLGREYGNGNRKGKEKEKKGERHISFNMSTKHYFPDTAVNTLVPRYLSALTASNPHLSLIPEYRVVTNSNHSPSKVALISGGGSGHEPAWYVTPTPSKDEDERPKTGFPASVSRNVYVTI